MYIECNLGRAKSPEPVPPNPVNCTEFLPYVDVELETHLAIDDSLTDSPELYRKAAGERKTPSAIGGSPVARGSLTASFLSNK